MTDLTRVFPSWPHYSKEEARAVCDVLLSNQVNYLAQCRNKDSVGRDFEQKFAEWSQNGHAIAVANGTVALDLALHGLGIGRANGGGEHDEVVVTPRTFIASVSTVVNAGAVPVFADIDRDSGNISAATIAPVLTDRTRAIIVVHLGGWPADMAPIIALASQRGIKVIEDCAQAHGARYRGRSVGSIGDAGAWSFCTDKIMTTGGEGGMVTTNDDALWSRMWSFKDHGKDREDYCNPDPDHVGFRYLHHRFGTNWRLTEMQCAIGRFQLGRMQEWTRARTGYAMTVAAALRRHAGVVRVPLPDETDTHAFYRLYAYVRPEGLRPGWDRNRIVHELHKQRGLPVMHGTCSEVYREAAFDGTPWRPEPRLPVAHELGETSLMFTVNPLLTAEDAAHVAQGVDEVLSQAGR